MNETPDTLDIQHDTDPAEDHGTVRRIPNLLHALLFFFIALSSLVLVVTLLHAFFPKVTSEVDFPRLALATEAAQHVITLLIAVFFFPRIWRRSFLHGIQWNVLAAHRRWLWVVPAGIALSAASQFADRFISVPENPFFSAMMRARFGPWMFTAFGILLAPLIEEIAFRGFLLPALATAYDWLTLERTPQALHRWETTAGHTTPALVFAAIFSTIPFALLHAGQLSHAWGAVSVIFGVGLVLALVRIRTHSVACSTLLHAVYNATIFAVILFQTGGYRHLEKL